MIRIFYVMDYAFDHSSLFAFSASHDDEEVGLPIGNLLAEEDIEDNDIEGFDGVEEDKELPREEMEKLEEGGGGGGEQY